MRKYVTAVLVMVLLLVVAPWGIGRLAQARINAGLDQLLKEAPYLSIAERKWSSGWFRSQLEVTFEVLGPWSRLMQDAEKPAIPLRFTVRNEILHGPVLWPASLGLARVNTKLVMSETIHKLLMETFGTDEPVRLSTRVGFFGGGTTTLSGDARTVKLEKDAGVLSYDAFYLDLGFSKTHDHVDADGEFPRIEFSGKKDAGQLLMENMTLTSQMNRIHGDLYDTDFHFGIEKMQVLNVSKKLTEISKIHYDFDTNESGDFVEFVAKLGSGKFASPELAELKLDVNEINYDFTVRRLDAQTLENLMTAIKASYEKPIASVADVEQALTSPYKKYGLALLKHDPEFVIDRIGIVTPEGEGVIKGVLRLKGVTEEDFDAGSAMGLVGKVEADLTIDVAQKLIEKLPNGATSAGLAIDQGYAKRDGERVVSHIEFRHGELKINGKSQPLPGLGGPAAGPPPEQEPPPPASVEPGPKRNPE